MQFRVMAEDTDYCHKIIKYKITGVVHSQMSSCIYIPLPLLRTVTTKNKTKQNVKKKIPTQIKSQPLRAGIYSLAKAMNREGRKKSTSKYLIKPVISKKTCVRTTLLRPHAPPHTSNAGSLVD